MSGQDYIGRLQHVLSYVIVVKHVKSNYKQQMGSLNLFAQLQDWVKELAESDPNWKFWMNFVFRCPVTLFHSIRGCMWELRLYGVKQIAPLFAAFDRPHCFN